MSSHVLKALNHTLVTNSIRDTVQFIADGGVPKDAAEQIIAEFTNKALLLGLSERVTAQDLDDPNWKKAWGSASVTIFLKKGGNKRMQECLAQLSAAGYQGKADEHLLNLVTAVCGIGQMIMQGVNPMMLFNS